MDAPRGGCFCRYKVQHSAQPHKQPCNSCGPWCLLLLEDRDLPNLSLRSPPLVPDIVPTGSKCLMETSLNDLHSQKGNIVLEMGVIYGFR